MKKTITIVIIAILVIIGLFPKTVVYEDGGTKTYSAFLYKYIKWQKMVDCDKCVKPYYKESELIFFPNNFKSLDSYWKEENIKKIPQFKPNSEKNPEKVASNVLRETLIKDFNIDKSFYDNKTTFLWEENGEQYEVDGFSTTLKDLENPLDFEKVGWGESSENSITKDDFFIRGFQKNNDVCLLTYYITEGTSKVWKKANIDISCGEFYETPKTQDADKTSKNISSLLENLAKQMGLQKFHIEKGTFSWSFENGDIEIDGFTLTTDEKSLETRYQMRKNIFQDWENNNSNTGEAMGFSDAGYKKDGVVCKIRSTMKATLEQIETMKNPQSLGYTNTISCGEFYESKKVDQTAKCNDLLIDVFYTSEELKPYIAKLENEKTNDCEDGLIDYKTEKSKETNNGIYYQIKEIYPNNKIKTSKELMYYGNSNFYMFNEKTNQYEKLTTDPKYLDFYKNDCVKEKQETNIFTDFTSYNAGKFNGEKSLSFNEIEAEVEEKAEQNGFFKNWNVVKRNELSYPMKNNQNPDGVLLKEQNGYQIKGIFNGSKDIYIIVKDGKELYRGETTFLTQEPFKNFVVNDDGWWLLYQKNTYSKYDDTYHSKGVLVHNGKELDNIDNFELNNFSEKTFYFFQTNDGKISFYYDKKIYKTNFDVIIHDRCCEAAKFNIRTSTDGRLAFWGVNTNNNNFSYNLLNLSDLKENNKNSLSMGKFSLQYPDRFLDYGEKPKISEGKCEENNIENILTIDKGLSDLYDSTDLENLVKNENINGNDYITIKIDDAAAGNIYHNYILSTKKDDNCYVVNLQIHQTNCENYLPLEDGNKEQETSYNKCLENTKNEITDVKEIKSSFLIN